MPGHAFVDFPIIRNMNIYGLVVVIEMVSEIFVNRLGLGMPLGQQFSAGFQIPCKTI